MHVRLYRAARDHLQQADAILSRLDDDALAVRTVIRYVVTILNEKSGTVPLADNVVPLEQFRRDRTDS